MQNSTKILRFYSKAFLREYSDLIRKNSALGILTSKTKISLEKVFVERRLRRIKKAPQRQKEQMLSAKDSQYGVKNPANKQKPNEKSIQPEKAVPLKDLLEEHEKAVIMGSAGSGKSILLRHIALQAVKTDDNRYPFLIELDKYDINRYKTIEMFIIEHAIQLMYTVKPFLDESDKKDEIRNAFKQAINRGKSIILIDGLDEIKSNREEVIAQIEDFVNRTLNQVYITTRPTGYRLIEGIEHYELEPFNRSEQTDLIKKWSLIEHISEEGFDNFTEELNKRTSLTRLTENPLLLTFAFLNFTKSKDYKLPEKRYQIYEQLLNQAAIEWGLMRAGIGEAEKSDWQVGPFQGTEAVQVVLDGLPPIGWAINNANQADVIDDEIQTQLDDWAEKYEKLDEGEKSILKEAIRNFWIKDVGLITHSKDKKKWWFLHTSFREYLAAVFLHNLWKKIGRKSIWRQLKPRLHAEHWHEVILFLGSMLDDKDATWLVRKIKCANSKYERLLGRDIMLASEMIGTGASVKSKLRKRLQLTWLKLINKTRNIFPASFLIYIPRRLIKILLSVFVLTAFILATQTLIIVRLPIRWLVVEALAVLIYLFFSRLYFRQRWIWWIQAPGKYFWKLVWSLFRNHRADYFSSDEIVKALEYLKPLPLKQAIRLPIFESKRFADLKIDSLGMSGSRKAIRPLLDLLVNGNSTKEISIGRAKNALNSLINQLGNEAIDELIYLASTPKIIYSVRIEAIKFLGELGESRAVPPLIELLQQGEYPKHVVQALGEIGDSDAIKIIIKKFPKSNYYSLQSKILRALGKTGDISSIAHLESILSDQSIDYLIKIEAAKALGKFKNERAANILSTQLREQTFYEAGEVLASMGEVGAGKLIQIVQQGDHPGAEKNALEFLGKIENGRVLELLLNVWDDNNRKHYVRQAAREAVENISVNKSDLPLLEKALHQPIDDSVELSRPSIVAKKIAEIDGVDILESALHSSEHMVIRASAFALAKLGSAVPNKTILQLTYLLKNHSDSWTRAYVARTLGEIGNPIAISTLKSVIQEDDADHVREYAAKALGKIRAFGDVDVLLNALEDENYDVRLQAAIALARLGEPKAINVLFNLLEDPDQRIDQKVKSNALKVLSEFDSAIPKLLELLFSDRFKGFEKIILKGKTDPRIIPALLEHGVRLEKNRISYWTRLEEIVESLNEHAVFPLLNCIVNSNEKISKEAAFLFDFQLDSVDIAKAFAMSSPKSVIEKIRAVNDDLETVHEKCLVALGELRNDAYVDFLINRLLNDKSHTIKAVAVKALGLIGNSDAIDPILQIYAELKNKSRIYYLPEAIIEALANLGYKKDLSIYKKAMWGYGGKRAAKALLILGRSMKKKITQKIARMLKIWHIVRRVPTQELLLPIANQLTEMRMEDISKFKAQQNQLSIPAWMMVILGTIGTIVGGSLAGIAQTKVTNVLETQLGQVSGFITTLIIVVGIILMLAGSSILFSSLRKHSDY